MSLKSFWRTIVDLWNKIFKPDPPEPPPEPPEPPPPPDPTQGWVNAEFKGITCSTSNDSFKFYFDRDNEFAITLNIKSNGSGWDRLFANDTSQITEFFVYKNGTYGVRLYNRAINFGEPLIKECDRKGTEPPDHWGIVKVPSWKGTHTIKYILEFNKKKFWITWDDTVIGGWKMVWEAIVPPITSIKVKGQKYP